MTDVSIPTSDSSSGLAAEDLIATFCPSEASDDTANYGVRSQVWTDFRPITVLGSHTWNTSDTGDAPADWAPFVDGTEDYQFGAIPSARTLSQMRILTISRSSDDTTYYIMSQAFWGSPVPDVDGEDFVHHASFSFGAVPLGQYSSWRTWTGGDHDVGKMVGMSNTSGDNRWIINWHPDQQEFRFVKEGTPPNTVYSFEMQIFATIL